ncbi:uncharacterized protein [Nicotiana tomentosiformis]|uniref:uncharacterized protein n=1 Tax=Nicotiana tomentosiformis TaxID=4098 RepID=UPI00388CD03D
MVEFRTKPSLWSSFMSQKYCKKLNALVVPWKRGSHVWRKMLECRDLVEHQIVSKPKMGLSLFWSDNWTGLGSLYFGTPPDFFCDETIHNVYDVVNEGAWDVEKLYDILPEDLAIHILENVAPPIEHHVLDKPIWNLETKGNFSVKTSWDYLRRRKDAAITYKNMWVKGFSFKISFFMWKLWKGRIPLDDAIRRIGWPDILHMMERYVPKLKFNKVIWELPMDGWIKINTDGASRGNPGRSSIGFCVRNELRDIVYAVGKDIDKTTSTQVETIAILETLKYCLHQGMVQIWLETYSMLLKNVIQGIWKPPWIIENEVEEI